jgi:hypothetical protein
MHLYDFEVLKGDETIAAERSIMLRNTRAAWPRIARLAASIATPGCLIRVKNESGETVFLVGADSARHLLDARPTRN